MFLIENVRKKPHNTAIELCEFDDVVVDYAAELFDYVSAEEKEVDLFPQSTALALLFLSQIQTYGSIPIAMCKSCAFNWGIRFESIFSRLRNVNLIENFMTNRQQGYFIKDMNWSNDSESLLTISVREDLKQAAQLSKTLYLMIMDRKSNFPAHLPKNAELADKFYGKYREAPITNKPDNMKLRLILFTQSVAFRESGREKLTAEALSIIQEYHEKVESINTYFQTLAHN